MRTYRPDPVSSNISRVGYDPATGVLTIWFGERPYPFADVPPVLILRFLFAESLGSFFAKEIKGRFKGPEAPEEK